MLVERQKLNEKEKNRIRLILIIFYLNLFQHLKSNFYQQVKTVSCIFSYFGSNALYPGCI